MDTLAASGLRLNLNALDYALLALYFGTVLGVGFAVRRAISTSADFFLSGRALPAWVTGLAFVSANLGAIEILGMAAKRMTSWAGFLGLLLGTLAAIGTYLLYLAKVLHFGSDLDESFWGAGIAFVTVAIVAVIVTFLTRPKPESALRGLVSGVGTVDLGDSVAVADRVWYRSPVLLGAGAVALAVVLYLPFL